MYRIISWHKWREIGILGLALLLLTAAAGTALGAVRRTTTAVAAASDGAICVPVIMYHGVLEESSRQGQYIISPSLLEGDLKAIRERGFTTVVMQDLIDYVDSGSPLPDKPIVLTFDDGYYNNYLYAFPLLKQYGMRAVLSPVAAWSEYYSLQDSDHAIYSHATWAELREMVESGVIEIQNHSYDMHYCTAGKRKGTLKRAGETIAQYQQALREDLAMAQRLLTEKVGVTPTTFTYPYGAMCEEAKPVLAELGFRATLSCESRINRITRDPACLTALGRYLRPAGSSSGAYFSRIDTELSKACR